MEKTEKPSNEQLYEDKYMTITNYDITLNCYYFPFCQKKVIPIKEIKDVELFDLKFGTGKYRVWGGTINWLWYPLDWRRIFKDKAIKLDLGKKIVPAISPETPEKAYNIIKSLLHR